MNEDFLDLLSALLDAEARFLIVGAYAVGVHARPRATKDLDVWVEASTEPRRIDILTQISGVTFEAAWESRFYADVGRSISCPFIGLTDLIRNKRAAARPQDMIDVGILERIATRKR